MVKIVLLLHDGIWFTCPDERATVTRVGEDVRVLAEKCPEWFRPMVWTGFYTGTSC